jgi:hypothetical protein
MPQLDLRFFFVANAARNAVGVPQRNARNGCG